MIEFVHFTDRSDEQGLLRHRRREISGHKVRCDTVDELQQYQQLTTVHEVKLIVNGINYVRLSSDNIKLLDEGVKMIEHEGKFYLPENTNTNGRSLQLSA